MAARLNVCQAINAVAPCGLGNHELVIWCKPFIISITATIITIIITVTSCHCHHYHHPKGEQSRDGDPLQAITIITIIICTNIIVINAIIWTTFNEAGKHEMVVPSLVIIAIIITRPKPAYGRQGLDWIVGPGYSFVVFSTNKTM